MLFLWNPCWIQYSLLERKKKASKLGWGLNFGTLNAKMEKYNDTENFERAACPPSPKQWSSSLEPHSVELNFWVFKDEEPALWAWCSSQSSGFCPLGKAYPCFPSSSRPGFRTEGEQPLSFTKTSGRGHLCPPEAWCWGTKAGRGLRKGGRRGGR